MSAPVRIVIEDQVSGVEFARQRLAAELAAGPSAMDPFTLATCRSALGRIDAALVTLRWLARDRDGCARLLATEFHPRA